MKRDGNRFSLVPSVSDELRIKLEEENVAMRAALKMLAAPFVSPPCTVEEGHWYVQHEFRRRMALAEETLAEIDFPDNEWSDA